MTPLAWFLGLGLVVLLAFGVPIGFSLLILAIGGAYIADINLLIIAQRVIAGTSVDSLLAIPGFILAGDLMGAGGLSKRLVRVASALFGHITGGLSIATVISGTFFGAISGSAPATTAAIGSVMLDELEEHGYERKYSAALATAVGPLGQMIPPSIPMVIWGVLSEQSISKLFLSGVIPGLIASAGFIGISVWYAKRHHIATDRRATARETLIAFKESVWALVAPLIILGGIYGGIFTPTEASMVGALYGFIAGTMIYRELTIKEMFRIVIRSLKLSGLIMFIICAAYGFAYVMAAEQIPQKLVVALTSISGNPIIILLLLNIMLLILGALMDTVAAMVILSSVITTLGAHIGMDPIQTGAIVVINFAVGMVTPPVGYSLFIGASISGISIEEVSKRLLPFILVLIGVVMLVTYVPFITTWLPSLIG